MHVHAVLICFTSKEIFGVVYYTLVLLHKPPLEAVKCTKSWLNDMFLLILLAIPILCTHGYQIQNQQQHVIYVESSNGTTEISCWTGGLELPCQTLELALQGASIMITAPSKLLLSTHHVPQTVSTSECPTWTHLKVTNGSTECVCGTDYHGAVKCRTNFNETYILECYQMTLDDQFHLVVGKSFYGCVNNAKKILTNMYRSVPARKSQLDENMCGQFNRSGRLCGACKSGYSPLVISYKLYCKNCSESERKYNWVKISALTFIPLTAFYFFTLLVRFNANSPSLQGFVLLAHFISAPVNVRVFLSNSYTNTVYARIIIALYGIWSLDFFRTFLPDMCLNLTTLQILSLEYGVAFFPLFLILVTYLLFKLHSYNFRILICTLKPFQHLFFKFNKRYGNVKASLIGVFATYLLLSYNKILSVNFDLLAFTVAVNERGEAVGRYLYYDATYKYFGRSHLPYAILALLIFTAFNALPFLLLLLYPLKCFQRCLNHFRLSHLALHTFVDSFAGCYKDGTEPGTRDCRYFAALFLFIRILFYIVYETTLTEYFYGLIGLILAGFTIAFTVVRPYKATHDKYNTVTSTMLMAFLLILIAIMNYSVALAKMHQTIDASIIIMIILIALPQLYLLGMVFKYILKQCPSKHREAPTQKLCSESSLLAAAENRTQPLQEYEAITC